MASDVKKAGIKSRVLDEKGSYRNVEYIIYPDQIIVPKGEDGQPLVTPKGRLVSYLETAGVQAALSPLHVGDMYDLEDVIAWRKRYAAKAGLEATAEEVIENSPKIGQIKEPHWHLDVYLSGQRKREYFHEWISQVCDHYPIWRMLKIERPDSATRYLAHLDCPSKVKYPANEVLGFGGMDLSPLWRTDEVEQMFTEIDIRDAIKENQIRYFNQLVDWAIGTGDYQIRKYVKGNAAYWNNYLSGRAAERAGRNSVKNGGNVKDMIG